MPKSRYSKLIQEILNSMFEGFVLDGDKKLKVVNEAKAKETADKIHTLVLEKSRDLWEQFEAAEGSLRKAVEEINFDELQGDVSHMGTQSADLEKITDMTGAETMESTESLKDALGVEDFDLSSLFSESLDHLDNEKDEDRHLTDEGEGYMPEAGDEEDELEGDEFGAGDSVDDADMDPEGGVEGPEGEYDELEIGEPEDDMDMDGDLGAPAGDEMGDLEMGDEPVGDLDGEMGGDPEDELSDFDFDLDGEGGEEDPEMEEMMGMRMESEGEDDDDKDDDKEDDDKDDDDKPAFLKKDED